jgi:outer membrane protein assembly factor BamB
MRLRVWHIALVITGLVGCQTIQFERPQVPAASDWTTDDGSDVRSRAHGMSLDAPLEKAWEYSANGGFGPGSPLLLQDRIIVATRSGEIHTVDLETGKTRGFKQMVDVVEGSPLIHDGTLYIPSAWGRKVLVAYDLAKGVNRWRRSGIPFATSLIGQGDTVVGVDVEGTLRAIDVARGDEAWTLSLGDHLTVKASPVRVSESSILVADAEGGVRRVNLDTRRIEWETALPAPVYVSPATDGQVVVLATTRGTVHVLDAAQGTEIWSFAVAEHIRMGAAALGPDAIYFGATDGRLRALSRTEGRELWSVPFEDVITAPPLVVGSTVFVGTMGSELAALDLADGRTLWRTELKGRVKSAMAVAEQGLLVLTEPKWVVLFRPAGEHVEGEHGTE